MAGKINIVAQLLGVEIYEEELNKQIYQSLYFVSLSSGSDLVRLFAKRSAKLRTPARPHAKTRMRARD